MGNVPPQKDGPSGGGSGSGQDSSSGSRHRNAPGRNYHQQLPTHQQNQYGESIYAPSAPPPVATPPQHYQSDVHHSRSLSGDIGNPNLDAMQSVNSNHSLPNNSLDLLSLDDDTVPTVFRWEHGGRQVYITGTFNGWSRQIPMHRSGNDFTYIHNLRRGKHAFKFIVDDEWRFAPDQPTVADIEGRINNFIDVSDFKAYTGDKDFEERMDGIGLGTASGTTGLGGVGIAGTGEAAHAVTATGGDAEGKDKHHQHPAEEEAFSNNMPDLDEYTKEPPPLPPHLRHIILNKPPQLSDTAALPVPQHVALNHLYCTAIKDNMMVLGVTQRYKTKFVTTVYYSPCAS